MQYIEAAIEIILDAILSIPRLSFVDSKNVIDEETIII